MAFMQENLSVSEKIKVLALLVT